MKISLVYDSGIFWTSKNAGGTHISEVLKNLGKKHNIILFGPKNKENEIHTNNFNIEYVPVLRDSRINFIIYELLLFSKLFVFCLRKKPDIIYARDKYGICSLIISLLFNVPRIQEVNGLTTIESRKIGNSIIKFIVMTKLEALNYKFSVKIVVVSNELKKQLLKYFHIKEEKIVIIENGANTDLFRPINRKHIKEMLNFDINFKYIGYVGSFSEWHDLDLLVRSVPSILKSMDNVKFIMVGDGRMKNKIIEMVKEEELSQYFIFTGQINYSDVHKYMNMFDVGVILKNRNTPGSPLKLYEYMACGIPVIATDSSDFEVVKKYGAGILVRPEESCELSNAIVSLLKDEKLRENMGQNGRKYVVKNHSWKQVSEKLDDIISKNVSRKS